jgi:chloramphenicol O-acetyltransferase type B
VAWSLYDSQLQQSTQVDDRTMLICTTVDAFSKIGADTTTHFCQIGSYTYLTGASVVINTRIGRFCSIAHGLGVGLGMHPTHMLSSSPVFYSPGKQCGVTFAPEGSDFVEQAESIIGNDVWLGANVFIRDGVTIGDGAIVAAGSIVVKDVAAYSIVGGVPAREIRKRFDEESIAILLELQWWNWPEDVLKKAKPLIKAGDAKALEQWFNEINQTTSHTASMLQYA